MFETVEQPAKHTPRRRTKREIEAAAERAADNARSCTARTCSCGAPVLVGLDEDVAAAPAVADAEPVGYLAAVVACLSGRGVLARQRGPAGSGELHRLDDLQLADGGPRLPLHLEHECTSRAASSAGRTVSSGSGSADRDGGGPCA